MNYVKKPISIALFCLLSCSVFAVDNPQDVIGAEQFNSTKCIAENTQTCINSVCLTSDQRDCQATCQKTAQEKCQELSNE